ncbi:MAG: antibiotic biosynthesis monooxygenase [Planctomycetes bacterium]|nr:antibiotic biosynthesis monooxygenase [Planctomycetota bacterium]
MLTVVAKVRAKTGREAEVESELSKLVAATRKENGCLNYDLHRSQTEPNVFLFYENWTDRAALDAHAASPHMRAWGAKQPDMLAHGVEVNLFDMISDAPWLR